MRLASVVLAACTCAFAQPAPRPTSPPHLAAATTPPMGWNSYDYFGAAVTEPEFRAEVDFMKDHLLAAGWNTAVIDYLWFNPTGETSVHCDANGRPRDTLAMDAWGRLLPPPNRFP